MNELQYEDYVDLQPEEGDSNCFGLSLAANEKYLAVGDTKANRVIVYRHSSQQKWVRFRAVLLPTNPIIVSSKSSYTTYKLALAGDTLVIGAVTSEIRLNEQNRQFYPYRPPTEEGEMAYSNHQTFRITVREGLLEEAYTGAVYQILLTSNTSLERVDHPKIGELTGFSIAANGDKIAFAVATYGSSGHSSGHTILITNGCRRIFPASGEIALNDNLLIVGSIMNYQQGKVSIFDLADSVASPKSIKIPMFIANIGLVKNFIIVAEQLSMAGSQSIKSHLSVVSKTLILNISDLSTTYMEGIGRIFTYGNRLVRSYPSTRDGEVAGKLELFDFSSTLPPRLICTSTADVLCSVLTRDFLFTTLYLESRVCIFTI